MDSSNFSQKQDITGMAKPLNVGGATCECFKVKLYGKMHFLKRLKPELRTNPRYVAAMHKEFETGYNLDHPHLVRYVACNDDYLLTEYIDGITLEEFAKTNPAFFKSEEKVNRLLSSLVDVLGYLHSHQIVHLDLKPDNILITHVGNELKLTDLGFCYTDTYTDTMGRTDRFAAPEQLDGKGSVDHRTDIYAVGRIISTLPCATRYSKVIERCTKPDKEERFQSASELKKHLSKRRSKWPLITLVVAITGLIALSMTWWLSSKPSTKANDMSLSGDTLAQTAASTATPIDTTTTAIESISETSTATIGDGKDPSSQPIISNAEPNTAASKSIQTTTKQTTIDKETLHRELLTATQPIYNKYLKKYENDSTIDPYDQSLSEAKIKCLNETADLLHRLYETKYKPMGVLESDYNPIASKLISSYEQKVDRINWGKL